MISLMEVLDKALKGKKIVLFTNESETIFFREQSRLHSKRVEVTIDSIECDGVSYDDAVEFMEPEMLEGFTESAQINFTYNGKKDFIYVDSFFEKLNIKID